MLGLIVTLNDRPPIRAAFSADGMITAMAYVTASRGEDRGGRESMLDLGGLLSGAEEQTPSWLKVALSPGDQVQILIAEIDAPDPWIADNPHPDSLPVAPSGLGVFLNGVLIDERRATATNRVAMALVSWSRGAATNPTSGEHMELDVTSTVEATITRPLVLGDVVLLSMLPA